MTSYLVTYQIRRKEIDCLLQGNWHDKTTVVVVDEDARNAIKEVVDTLHNNDFRLRGIKLIGEIDIIKEMKQ